MLLYEAILNLLANKNVSNDHRNTTRLHHDDRHFLTSQIYLCKLNYLQQLRYYDLTN